MSGSLRIKYPKNVLDEQLQGLVQLSNDPNSGYNDYLQRLIKLIPGEAISIYITCKSLMGIDICKEGHWLPFACLIPLLVIRIWGTRVRVQNSNGGTSMNIEWSQILIALISYVLWIYAIGDCFIYPISSEIVGISVVFWTFLIPYIYKPQLNFITKIMSSTTIERIKKITSSYNSLEWDQHDEDIEIKDTYVASEKREFYLNDLIEDFGLVHPKSTELANKLFVSLKTIKDIADFIDN